MNYKYKAFISYNHKDTNWAEWLLRKLEAYHIPKKLVGTNTPRGIVPERLAPIFRDRDELPAAESLSDRLNEAIAASEYMIVICSPGAAQSQLVNKEVIEFKRVHGDKNLLALIVAGEPFAADSEKECFPPALIHKNMMVDASISFAAEGIAADVRAEGDGKRRSLLKIAAGMIGVGLDALVRREDRRRQKRMAIALAASVAVTLLTGGLAYEARTARDVAMEAQVMAEKRLNDSLEITSFLMSTVYEELLGVGNLQTLEVVINKTLKQYQSLPLEQLNKQQTFRHTGSMMRLGQLLDRKGQSGKARKIFEAALPLSRSMYKKWPNDDFAIHRLQNNLFFIGYMAKRQGRFEEAEIAYRERLSLAKLGRKHFPNGSSFNLKKLVPNLWHQTMADAEGSLAGLLISSKGNKAEALQLVRSSLAMRKTLDPEGSIGLGSSYQHLGDIYRAMGDMEKAKQVFAKRLALFDGMLDEASGTNYRLMRRRYTSLQNIGHIEMDQGEFSTAAGTFREAATGFDTLVAKDPANTLWLSGSAELYTNLATAYFADGKTQSAKKALATARTQSDETMKRDSSRVRRQVTAFEVSFLEAEIAMKDGNTATALAQLTTLSAAFHAKGKNFLRVNGGLALFAKVQLLKGKILAAKGNLETAEAEWQKITDTLTTANATLSPSAADSLASARDLLTNQ